MMDDRDSPGLVTDGPSQPRITNRAQGGARSDKTRFIRPVERQRMRPWLIGHLDENDIPGLVWQDKRDKIFRISWKHAANQCFNMQKDTNLFERWAIHTGRHQDSDHKRWKANFRCALNSLPDVAEMKEQGVKKGNNAFKVYRFLNEKEVKRGKETRQRRKREPFEFDEEEDGVPIKEEVEDSYFNDQPGTSSEADLGPSGSAIPDLNKLVSPISALDFNIESKEGLKQITGNMDSLQEILAAATASLAAGSDALALEKISIEQLSHLGEASKVKLDIRQSDRKRRKKEVTGILYVFLCHWCEKVFPSRVDLYQHFLIVHQDKLLSGEEYKMKRETLQQEIEDLEKKVLGFTQENIQTRDTEEVIEDGPIVDLSSNHSMTSQEIYIEDQALDLSIAGAMAKHTAVQPDVALDLSVNNSNKQKAPQKNVASKGVVKRRRSSAMDVDYTVKFGNYGLAGAPRTKRQLSLLLKKKEEEEEKQRKQAEAQHSMEDIAHAEILISLKSASNEENESESIELDDKAVKEAVNEQAQDVDMEEDGESKITDETNAELEQGQETMVKPEDEETGDSCVQDKVDGAGDREENTETVVEEHVNTVGKDNTSAYKCGICMESFENVISLNQHLSGSGNQCFAKLMSLSDVPGSQLGLSLPHVKSEKLCIVCKMKFQSVEELNEHKKTHPNLNPCNTCGEEFITVNELLSHMVKHKQSETQDENGFPVETIKKEMVSVGNGGDSSSTSSVSKITDQKNLKGEPVVSPAAGSETVTGMAMNDSMSADGDIVDDKGDAAVKKFNEISAEQVRKDHGDLGRKTDGDKKDVKKLSGNDVVDGEHLIETDAEHQSEFDDNIPKTLNLLSPKVKPDSSPVAVNLLNSDEIRKDMVLCGLCNLRLDFKDVQSHLESHKFAQDRKTIEVKEDCPCMICDKMIPIKTFYTHLRSHSVYDLSVALSTQMNVEKNVVKKGKCVCNLCYSTFNTQSELMHHVKSHLGPRNASEPKKATAQKRKLPASEKKSKKLKTKDNTQSRKSAKKKQAKNSSASPGRSSDKKLVNDDSVDLFKLKHAAVGGKSESSPALTAALNRKPKCETSIMALFAARNKKVPVVGEHVDKLEGGKAPKKEVVVKTESADSDVSNNESEMSSQVGEEKISEDENFLAASRRLQEFVTLKDYEQSIKVSEASVDTDLSKQTGTVESEDNSSTTKSKKSLQQKILLVRHGDVKVATPFFSPVTSIPVESSQQNPVALYKPVISQTKRHSNVPVLSPTKGTNMTGKSKKPTSTSKSSAIVSGSSVSATMATAVPVSLVRNLFNLPVGKNTSLKHVSAVTLKKDTVSNLQASRTPIPSVSSVSQITVDPSAMTKVSGSPTSLSSSTIAQVSGLGLSQEVSTNMQTPSVPLSSASKLASSQTLAQALPLQQQLPGGMNVNIVMGKSQSSSNKSVLLPGMSNAGVKSPVFHLAFVSVGDKTPEPVSMGINSFQDMQTKPITSTVSQRVFKCHNCRQPLSSIKQLTNHVCNTASKSSPGQQSVSLTLMASSSEYDLKTSGIMSDSNTTPHTKVVSTPTILKPSLSTLKFPLVGSIPSTNSGTQASGVNVLSSPVGIGMDKAKFVLSRSAILAKSLAVPLNSTSSTQTGSVLSSSALASTESLTIGSNLLRVSTGSLSSAGIKEGNQALALYPCGICKQIYMNQDSFIKHMQEHVSTKLEIKDEASALVESNTSKTISPDLKVGNSVQRRLSQDEDVKMNISGTTLKDVGKTTTKTIENLFTPNMPNSVVSEEVPEVWEQNCDLVNQSIECLANKSGKNKMMACRRCLSVFDNEKALAEHYKGVHPNTSSFRCYSDNCTKSFCKEKDVDFHYSMEHIHKCAACLHRYKSYAEFENHVKKHAKETDSSVLVCTMCNEEFMTRSDMNAHLTESASCRDGLQYETTANILCDDCHGYFSSSEPFVEHFRSHYIKLAYRCCICLMEYSVAKSADLQVLENKVLKHMNGHVAQVSDKLYFCHVCYFLFPNREVQSFHMASDSHKEQIANKLGNKQQSTNSKVFKKVGLTFKRKTVKIPSSSPAKKFRGKKSKDDDSYTTEQVLSCVACNVCFSTLFQLKAHKAIWHRSNRKGQHVPTNRNLHPTGRWDKLLVCELCGKRFFSLNLLQRHRDNHDLMVSKLMCKELSCMRIFATKSDMKSHVCAAKTSKVADSTSTATEQYGALTMFTPHELEQYIIQHDGSDSEFHLEKAASMIERLQVDLGDFFHCMFCKKSFATSDPLKQHMLKTHSKKLFQCVDCEQYFHKNVSLMIHRRDCAVTFSDQDFHSKKQYYGCDVCYRSFIQLVSLACYIADMKTDKTDEIVAKPDLKMSLDRLKLENENKSSGSLVSNLSGKFVCMECRNEYCDADDLYTCMRSRLDHEMKKVLSSRECGKVPDTLAVFTNDSMFYCNKCENIVCFKAGEMCLATLEHPCIHSETLI